MEMLFFIDGYHSLLNQLPKHNSRTEQKDEKQVKVDHAVLYLCVSPNRVPISLGLFKTSNWSKPLNRCPWNLDRILNVSDIRPIFPRLDS